jgi:hypothetical protein
MFDFEIQMHAKNDSRKLFLFGYFIMAGSPDKSGQAM